MAQKKIRRHHDCFPKARSLKETITRRLDILYDILPFSREEIDGWALVYTLIAASWSVQDHGELLADHLDIADFAAVVNRLISIFTSTNHPDFPDQILQKAALLNFPRIYPIESQRILPAGIFFVAQPIVWPLVSQIPTYTEEGSA